MKTHALERSLTVVCLLALAVPAASQEVIGRDGKVKVELVWAKTETKNYVIRYEKVIPEETVAKIGEELEDILVEYQRLFPLKLTEKFQTQLLDNQNTFNQVGGDVNHPGFYTPSNRTLVLLQREFKDLIPTTYHEAFHQYLDAFVGYDAPIPIWFNEGMATYYEGMMRDEKSRAKKLDATKIHTGKIRMVQGKIRTRQSVPLAKLIDADHETFHERDEEDLYYHQSFALVYYFMETTKGRGPKSFVHELQKSKDPEAALEKLIGKDRKNLDKLEAHWKAFTAKVEIRTE